MTRRGNQSGKYRGKPNCMPDDLYEKLILSYWLIGQLKSMDDTTQEYAEMIEETIGIDSSSDEIRSFFEEFECDKYIFN